MDGWLTGLKSSEYISALRNCATSLMLLSVALIPITCVDSKTIPYYMCSMSTVISVLRRHVGPTSLQYRISLDMGMGRIQNL